jgi:D-serine dehydratase
MMNGKRARPDRVARVFVRLVGYDNNTLGAFGGDLTGDLRHGKAAVVGLAAGHRHRVVKQDFVGDVRFGSDGGADRHIAGMVVGAIAKILKNVFALGERRFADPVRALAAHLRVTERRSVHPLCHEMAADAGIGAHAFRHHGRRIVRAARTKIRNALRDIARCGGNALEFLQARHALRDFVMTVVL